MEIRPCNREDIPWLRDLARETYAPLIPDYDVAGAASWIAGCVLSEEIITLRGENAAVFASVMEFPWTRQKACEVFHLFSRPRVGTAFDPVRLVEAVHQIARRRGCDRTYLGSVFHDLSPIGKRLGGRPLTTTYVLEG